MARCMSNPVKDCRPVPPSREALRRASKKCRPVKYRLPVPRRRGPSQESQPPAESVSPIHVTLAELSVPVLAAAPTAQAAAGPEVARLVTLARAGDRAAFGRLIEDHLPAAHRVALAAVGQASDADEAVQDASVAAWKRLDALQEPAAFRGWFMRIVWRKALDRRRTAPSRSVPARR